MVKGHSRSLFVCQECGRESPKWVGLCPGCQQWNTYLEKVVRPSHHASVSLRAKPEALSKVGGEGPARLEVPIGELNRVLGGGIVPGSLVLLSGDPGVGKSTLLLQLAALLSESLGRVLYVSGEESAQQVRIRAERLGLVSNELYLLAETTLEAILEGVQEVTPRLVVVDSIQAVHLEELGAPAGSIAQVRECTQRLMHLAKGSNIPVFIVGHVTKEGAIAGPRLLEHMVDTVLYLEGERFSSFRLLRSNKNRFGSTQEVGVFEMRGEGLAEVADPSQAFLAERPREAVGSAVVPALEGTRPLLVEVQALNSPTSFGLPRRNANGVDYNRLLMLVAVLTQRVGLGLGDQDIFVNVVGGLKLEEPAADLGIALALASSFRGLRLPSDLVFLGEVGLGGELRGVSQIERRLTEAAKLGFRGCLLPSSSLLRMHKAPGIELIGAPSLAEALQVVRSL